MADTAAISTEGAASGTNVQGQQVGTAPAAQPEPKAGGMGKEAGKDAGVLDDGVKAKIETLRKRIEQTEIVQDIKQLEDQTLKKQEEQNE